MPDGPGFTEKDDAVILNPVYNDIVSRSDRSSPETRGDLNHRYSLPGASSIRFVLPWLKKCGTACC
jgi:hypothetical protein